MNRKEKLLSHGNVFIVDNTHNVFQIFTKQRIVSQRIAGGGYVE